MKSIEVPLTVSVRAPWYGPATLLFISMVSGLALNYYFAKRKSADDILLLAGKIEAGINGDHELAPGRPCRVFFEKINSKLTLVTHLISQLNETATKIALDDAVALYNKWVVGRDHWFQSLSNLASYLDLVTKRRHERAGRVVSLTYLDGLKKSFSELRDDAPDQSNPAALAAAIEPVAAQQGTYERLLTLIGKLPDGAVKTGFTNRLDSTAPGDSSSLAQLEREINAAVPSSRAWKLTIDLAAPAVQGDEGIPSIAALSPSTLSAVRLRQAIFDTAGYFVALVLLFLTGFYTLYWQKATFGSDPFTDYSLLIGYGMGATTLSRPAALGAFSSWRLAGLPTT